jgi:hypothetical protein
MVFNRDISDEDFAQAQKDVLAAKGIITHKYTAGLKGLGISIPDDTVNTFDSKDYVKFMEEDQSGTYQQLDVTLTPTVSNIPSSLVHTYNEAVV